MADDEEVQFNAPDAGEQNIDRLARALRQPNRREVKPPTYDGKSDVRKFLDLFQNVVDVNRWNDDTAALNFQLALTGTARECLHGNTYDELRESLQHRYQTTQEEARRELRNLRWRTGEDVFQFGDHVKKLVRLAHPDMDDEQRNQLVVAELVEAAGDKMLRREFRLQPTDDVAEAMTRIKDYHSDMGKDRKVTLRPLAAEEMAEDEKELVKLVKRLSKVETDTTLLSTEMKDLKEKLLSQQSQILKKLEERTTQPRWQSDRNGRPRSKECYNCGGNGHFARDCPSQKKQTSKPTAEKSGNDKGSAQ